MAVIAFGHEAHGDMFFLDGVKYLPVYLEHGSVL